MADFFISYNEADKNWAEWIGWTLEAEKYSVILQDWDFRAGQTFPLKMDEALASSDRMIAVLSQNYLDATYTHSEWANAFADDPKGAKRKLIPVKVGACKPKGLLKTIIHINFLGKTEEQAKTELLNGLKERGKPPTKPAFHQSVPEDASPEPEPKPEPAPVAEEPQTQEPEAARKAPPEFPGPGRPGLGGSTVLPGFPRLSRGAWIIAGVVAVLIAGSLAYGISHWKSQEELRRKADEEIRLRDLRKKTDEQNQQQALRRTYDQQIGRLEELLRIPDDDLEDPQAQEMETLAILLSSIQQKIGYRPGWVAIYERQLCRRPNITDKIPRPPEAKPCP